MAEVLQFVVERQIYVEFIVSFADLSKTILR